MVGAPRRRRICLEQRRAKARVRSAVLEFGRARDLERGQASLVNSARSDSQGRADPFPINAYVVLQPVDRLCCAA
jgi:hypothetical protein